MSRPPFLVVPTLGNRPSIWPLLRDCGMPAVVVWTNPERRPDEAERARVHRYGATLVIDRGPIDIHRWWQQGLSLAGSANWGTAVIVNDDVRADAGELLRLADHVTSPDGGPVQLAYLDVPEHAAVRCTAITGWCFAFDWHSVFVPWQVGAFDPEASSRNLRWWYGDHDLELRVLTGGGVDRPGRIAKVAGLAIEHLRRDWRYDRPTEVNPLIAPDRVIFNQRWSWKVGVQ